VTPFKTILHPTDFSEQSGYAFDVACLLARDHGADLHVVHVRTPAVVLAGDVGPVPIDSADDRAALMAKLHAVRPSTPNIRVHHHLLTGDAASEIVRLAAAHRCDFIVMGTQGRRGLARAILGSVAEQVLRRAPCPVMTVKAPVAAAPPEPEPPRLARVGVSVGLTAGDTR
jgi:nucleotide-binding universal stress UspA family protein